MLVMGSGYNLLEDSEGNRSLSRSGCRLVYDIKIYLKEIRFQDVNWTLVAQVL